MIMNIATEIERLKRAKKELFEAIVSKGGSVSPDQKLDDYAGAVNRIPSSVEGFGKYRVRFFDYDGTILKTVYTDGGAATAPAVPEHDRLLFQEWNNDFDNVTDDLDVGAIYTTKSGASEFDFDLNAQTGLELTIKLNVLNAGLQIDWGDGSSETITTTGVATFSHEYASSGMRTVKIFGNWQNSDQVVRSPVLGLTSAFICGLARINNFLVNSARSLKVCTISATGYSGVGNYTFQSTLSLRHLNVPRLMGELNFAIQPQNMQNSGVRHVVLPSNCKKLTGAIFFQKCANLEDIVLPNSLDEIGAGCFADAQTGLSEIIIPPLVATIGDLAFRDRYSLSRVVMRPTTPPTIAEGTFPTGGSLKEIIVPAGCGEAYKSATNWSTFADIIREEEI